MDNNENLEIKGMQLYEKLVDSVESAPDNIPELVAQLRDADNSGQFLASSARFLYAIDSERFSPWIGELIDGAIEKDREHRYIGSLLQAIWGDDYESNAESLKASDRNFRRIYQRIHPEGSL